MGEYFKPGRNEKHVCDLPVAYFALAKGYRCDCGKAYVVKEEHQHGESWLYWKRAKEHDRA